MRLGYIITAATAALLIGLVGTARFHDNHLSRAAERVEIGMSQTEVFGLLGEPDWQGRCASRFAYGGERKGCVRELGYGSAFGPIIPAYFMIQLDAAGQVIALDMIQSP